MAQIAKELCVLFADVSGSTRLYELLGDTIALRLVEKCLSLMTQAIHLNNGRVVKTIGDEIMAVFDNALSATYAACKMQELIAELEPQQGIILMIRVGYHFGNLIENTETMDVFGDSVNVAARIAGLAKAGKIFTSKQVIQSLPSVLHNQAKFAYTTTVKGRQEPVDIYDFLWKADTDGTVISSLPGSIDAITPPPKKSILEILYGTQRKELSEVLPQITIGRGSNNDIILDQKLASRDHAHIEYRRGTFVLVDRSSNGTLVVNDDGQRLYVHKNECALYGSGQIIAGQTAQPDFNKAIFFKILS